MNGYRGWVGIGILLAASAPWSTLAAAASEANRPAAEDAEEAEDTFRPLWLTVLLAEGTEGGDAGTSAATAFQGCATSDALHATEAPAAAGSVEQERSLLFAAVAADVLAPHHAAFIDATESLVDAVAGYCAAPAEGDVNVVAAGWAAAMDAWQCVQFVRTGPVEQDNRRFRIQLFPDPNEAVQRNVATLLDGDEAITESRLRGSPVGAQGLPAFEHLLFDDALRLTDPEAAPRRCDLAGAIAGNLHSMAREIGEPWAAGGAVRQGFVSGGEPFTGSADVLLAIVEAIAVQAEFIADAKLGNPLAQGNVGGLESPLAGRSKANIVANVSALQALVDDEDEATYRFRDYLRRAHDADAIGADLATALAEAVERLAAFDARIEDILAGTASGDVAGLEDVFQRISRLGEDAAVAVGVQLGFNDQDGD